MPLPWELWAFCSTGYTHNSPKHQVAIPPISNVPLEWESSPSTLHLVGNVVMGVFLFWELDGYPQTLAGTTANNNFITKLMDNNTSVWARKSQGQQETFVPAPQLPCFCLRVSCSVSWCCNPSSLLSWTLWPSVHVSRDPLYPRLLETFSTLRTA